MVPLETGAGGGEYGGVVGATGSNRGGITDKGGAAGTVGAEIGSCGNTEGAATSFFLLRGMIFFIPDFIANKMPVFSIISSCDTPTGAGIVGALTGASF